jgi:uncharacterized protein
VQGFLALLRIRRRHHRQIDALKERQLIMANLCDYPGCDKLPSVHICAIHRSTCFTELAFCDDHAQAEEPFAEHNHIMLERLPDSAVPFQISHIVFFSQLQSQAVYLTDLDGKARLSFTCGYCEASALYHATKHKTWPRPPTHIAMASIIRAFGGYVQDILIDGYDDKDRVFLAKMRLLRESELITIDIRPSDGISIAIYADAPILVDGKLLAARNKNEV